MVGNFKRTDWFDISVRPKHRGRYEVLLQDNTIIDARFKGKNWFEYATKTNYDIALIQSWRGRCGLIDEAQLDARVDFMRSNRRRKDMRPLFRHWASEGAVLQACQQFKIGEKLGAKFSRAEKRAYEELSRNMAIKDVLIIEKSVREFFGTAE